MSLSVNDAAASEAEGPLHNENANQLTVTDELVLVKQQLAQVVRSVNALTSKLMPASLQQPTVAAAASTSQPQQPQQQLQSRPRHTPIPVLAQDGILDTICSFVGIGDYYYVAGVCRNWRGRYMAFCHSDAAKDMRYKKTHKLYTSGTSAAMTAARLQLALDNGLSMDKLNELCWRLARTLALHSLERIAVLTIARCYGLEWHDDLPQLAAGHGKLEVLEWMHKCGCPFVAEAVIEAGFGSNDLATVNWLYKQFEPSFTAEFKQNLLWRAGYANDLLVAKWLRGHGAEWPDTFCFTEHSTFDISDIGDGCWSLECVQWAIASGSTWREWRCCHYDHMMYECFCDADDHADESVGFEWCNVKRAARVFKWAHKNGCPCTCAAEAAATAAAAAQIAADAALALQIAQDIEAV
jgi:hypothetical protein